MMVLGAFALLLLTAAIVVLYAMMSELASRVPAAEAAADQVKPLDEYTRGATAESWPAGLAGLAGRHSATLLVLSPICDTCNKVAAEMADYRPDQLDGSLGIVVSCNNRETGEAFLDTHSIGHLPHLVDEGGSWVTGNFGVNVSPSALVLRDGAVTDAYTFTRVGTLLKQLPRVSEGVS